MIVAASFDTTDPNNWVNRAMQYGDGVFETMAMESGQIACWPWHQRRLLHGLTVLQLSQPDLSQIKQNLKTFGQHHTDRNWVMKLMVFRAAQARTYRPLTDQVEWLLTAEPMSQQAIKKPLRLAVANMHLAPQPALAGIKHLSRLEQVLLARELNEHPDVDDLLVLDQAGQVIETTYQNVVLIKQQQLFTPKLDNCGVDGVALEWLKQEHDVLVAEIALDDLRGFEAMMVCNAVRGFQLVSEVNRVNSFVTSHAIHDKISHQWAIINHS